MTARPTKAPSRAALRRLLERLAVPAPNFNAFLLDHFDEVHRRLGAGADLVSKINLLLELHEREVVWRVLRQHFPELIAQNEGFLAEDVERASASEWRDRQRAELDELCRDRAALQRWKDDPQALETRIHGIRILLRSGPELEERALLGDRYSLMKRLGRGGMAEVWLAHDRRSEQSRSAQVPEVVALKILLGHHTGDETIRERFRRGAEIMRQLRHDHIVRVLAAPESDEWYLYFPMEYLPGGTLHDLVLAEQPPDEELVFSLMLQVGGALHYAHEAEYKLKGRQVCGLIHRDVTPYNILLDGKGGARLTDFDLVLIKSSSSIAGKTALGNLSYAAPEQFMKPGVLPLDRRADVYSFGMTLLFALSRREVLALDRAASLPELFAELPYSETLLRVLRRALSAKPMERYSTIAELCDALRSAWPQRKPRPVSPPISDPVPASLPLPVEVVRANEYPAAAKAIRRHRREWVPIVPQGPAEAATVAAISPDQLMIAQRSPLAQPSALEPPVPPNNVVVVHPIAVTTPAPSEGPGAARSGSRSKLLSMSLGVTLVAFTAGASYRQLSSQKLAPSSGSQASSPVTNSLLVPGAAIPAQPETATSPKPEAPTLPKPEVVTLPKPEAASIPTAAVAASAPPQKKQDIPNITLATSAPQPPAEEPALPREALAQKASDQDALKPTLPNYFNLGIEKHKAAPPSRPKNVERRQGKKGSVGVASASSGPVTPTYSPTMSPYDNAWFIGRIGLGNLGAFQPPPDIKSMKSILEKISVYQCAMSVQRNSILTIHTLSIEVRVSPTGKIDNCSVIGRLGLGSSVAVSQDSIDCVRKEVYAISFAPFAGSPVTISFEKPLPVPGLFHTLGQ